MLAHSNVETTLYCIAKWAALKKYYKDLLTPSGTGSGIY